MVDALEAVLPGLGDASCAHGEGEHPEVGRDTAEQATVGIHLLSPGGRGVYRHWHREELETAPLEAWLCPAFLAAIAREALDHLRAGRERLFGLRDTAHLDEVLLRPDGRLDIERLTHAVRFRCRDGQAAEDAGLWAARRFAAGPADPRERLVLLLVACWSVTSGEEAPPEAVHRDLRAILGAVRTDPAAGSCPHGEAHPWGCWPSWRAAVTSASTRTLTVPISTMCTRRGSTPRPSRTSIRRRGAAPPCGRAGRGCAADHRRRALIGDAGVTGPAACGGLLPSPPLPETGAPPGPRPGLCPTHRPGLCPGPARGSAPDPAESRGEAPAARWSRISVLRRAPRKSALQAQRCSAALTVAAALRAATSTGSHTGENGGA
ncbi:hypothetical protein SVIO_079360 [Streptomyces violaceusniger]|uniref:Uncharacterized protein n=1 Tax=Streptomyces violaceusniger TaxID=68280 RepID=A0A4D4LGS8_STRVO|nr:hypothetical protein SVIO_079360 [Streptomyces violaceusniger]